MSFPMPGDLPARSNCACNRCFSDYGSADITIPIVLSAGVCALIGLAFSVYPARQAAALDPIEAIRGE